MRTGYKEQKTKKFKVNSRLLIIFAVIFICLGAGVVGNYGEISNKVKEWFATDDVNDPNWNKDSARVLLRWNSVIYDGSIPGINYIHVYAKEGETICLGTTVYAARYGIDGKQITNGEHKDDNSVDIVLYDLNNQPHAIDIKKNGDGHIHNSATENSAKNLTSKDGDGTYKPYTYTVNETGVYTIEFRSRDGSHDNPQDATGVSFPSYKNEDVSKYIDATTELIPAWDVSVFDEANKKKTGRTYVDYLNVLVDGKVRENYYLLTRDSYIYQFTLNDVIPYWSRIFANNIGLNDAATNNIVYKSVKSLTDGSFNNMENELGISYRQPGSTNTDTYKNAYMFFEKPSEDLKGVLYDKAVKPDPAKNLRFVGASMENDSQTTDTYVGTGGYFAFDVEEASSTSIYLDFSGVSGGPYAPVELSEPVIPYSTNYFYWDGKDGNGKPIPQGNYNLGDLVSNITTKAGELHVPFADVEWAYNGVTLTRIGDLYDSSGKIVSDEIYDKTRSVLYYDDSAVYYGESVATTGKTEDGVYLYKNNFSNCKQTDSAQREFFPYANYTNINGLGERAYYEKYGKNHNLKVGDHSHITNIIDYSKNYEEQKDVIDYLDSSKNPAMISQSSDPNAIYKTGTSYDFGIENLWTFTPSSPVKPTDDGGKVNIVDPNGKKVFNLNSRVFFDESGNGVFEAQTKGEYLLSNVRLNLYKKTTDTQINPKKKYVNYEDGKIVDATAIDTSKTYELVQSAITVGEREHIFSGLEYDDVNGTDYLFETIKPSSDFKVTTESFKPTGSETAGIYNLYSYNASSTGTEIQAFKVGGSGIKPYNKPSNTITTIDVGYNYETVGHSFEIRKAWNTPESEEKRPKTTVFEVSYSSNGEEHVYDERALSVIFAWNYSYGYLDNNIDGVTGLDYFVSAEYYIYEDKIFRHKFAYDLNTQKYKNFVGNDSYFSISEYNNSNGGTAPSDGIYDVDDIPDLNHDGEHTWDDLKSIEEEQWKIALPAGSQRVGEEVIAPYKATIDRNVKTDKTEITITNSSEPAVIELYKYTGEDVNKKALEGATFRLYKGTIDDVKAKIDAYNNALAALNSATPENRDALQQAFDIAAQALNDIQVESGTTRSNGRYAFSGLDPNETYTVRERLAPSGYRILEEYYQVNPKDSLDPGFKFDESNYCELEVGNAKSDGKLELRKRVVSRAWIPTDSFEFVVDTSAEVEIDSSDKALLSNSSQNADTLVSEFLNNVKNNGTASKKVDYTNNYMQNEDGTYSADTKVANNFFSSGIPANNDGVASIVGISFPVAGVYTFAIYEKPDNPTSLIPSKLIYVVQITVSRVLNVGHETEQLTLANSHLEANVSKITYTEYTSYQDGVPQIEEGSFKMYADSSLLFENIYHVDNVVEETNYKVTKNFTGRENDKWLDTDVFSIIVDGHDETTKDALVNGNLIVKSTVAETPGNEGLSKKEFVIPGGENAHEFTINELDFQNVEFPVERGDDGEPHTQPLVYYLDIYEKIPDGAISNIFNGITYSSDIYTLKIQLLNSVNSETQETDGIIDEIIFDLYKNYNYDDEPSNSAVCHCVVTRTKEESGEVKETVVHDSREGSHDLVFNNTYSASSVTWTPTLSKTLSGREWVVGDSFTFSLSLTSGDESGVAMGNSSVTITPSADRLSEGETYSEVFGDILFTKTGDYTFEITETFNNQNGISVSTPTYTIVVHVTDDNEGNLYLTFNDADSSLPVINFVNSYTELGVVDLSVRKTLEGRGWNASDVFTFKITPDDETKTAIDDGTLVMPESVGTPDGLGIYTFDISLNDGAVLSSSITKKLGEIKVTKATTTPTSYSFTISEVTDAFTNMECKDNDLTLNFTATRSVDASGIPTGDIDIVVNSAFTTASVDDAVTLIHKMYDFKRNTDATDDTPSHFDKEDLDLDEIGAESILEDDVDNVEKDTKNIDEKEETKEENKLFEVINAKAEVVIPFVNKAYIDLEDEDFVIEKVLTGRDWTSDDSFDVKVEYLGDNPDLIKYQDVGEYSPLTFNETTQSKVLKFRLYGAGEYVFKVTEIVPDDPIDYIKYDTSEYLVTITVTDNGDGTFTKSISVTKDGEPIDKVTITNNYANGNIIVSKKVQGNMGDKEQYFNFTITLDDTNINGTYGDLTFVNGVTTFTLKDGESKRADAIPEGIGYNIVETEANLDGYVTVATGNQGTVQDGVDSNAEFVNTKNKIEWQPKVSKTLNGREWVENDSFNFVLECSDADEYLIMPGNTTLQITPENVGTEGETFEKAFDSVVFTKAGTYHFTIHETFNNINGVVVSTSSYDIEVVVTDDGAGNLSITYNGEDVSPTLNFVNTYSENGKISLSVKKTLEGRDLTDEDVFTFYFTPDAKTKGAITDGTIVLPEAMVDNGDGRYKVEVSKALGDTVSNTITRLLGDISFTKGSSAGDRYSFTISEDVESLWDITCQTDTYTLDINVTREVTEGNVPTGNLEVVATYARDSIEPQKDNLTIPFLNVYESRDTQVKVLHVKKGADVSDPENVAPDDILYPTEVIPGRIDDPYTTQNRENEINESSSVLYRVVNDNVDKKSGTMTKETIYVVYEYDTVPGKVHVKHLEKGTDAELYEEELLEGLVREEYHTSDRLGDINEKYENKYELVEEPANKDGAYTEEDITVTYYYQKKESRVIVSYKEEETEKELHEDIVIGGRVDDEYITENLLDDINEKFGGKYKFKETTGDETRGHLGLEEKHVTYWYTYLPDLYITKTVKGNLADLDKNFSFTINLNDVAGTPITDDVTYTIYDTDASELNTGHISSSGSFNLKHGQKLKLAGIPKHTTYDITETNGDDYVTYVNDEENEFRTISAELLDDTTVNFVNEKEYVAPTGVTFNVFPFIIGLVLIVGLYVIMKKYNDTNRHRAYATRYHNNYRNNNIKKSMNKNISKNTNKNVNTNSLVKYKPRSGSRRKR